MVYGHKILSPKTRSHTLSAKRVIRMEAVVCGGHQGP